MRMPTIPSIKNGHQRWPVSAARTVATIAKIPSTNAYAPKKIAIVIQVTPGHFQARTPKMIAAIPRISHTHQLRVRRCTITRFLSQLLQHVAVLQVDALDQALL